MAKKTARYFVQNCGFIRIVNSPDCLSKLFTSDNFKITAVHTYLLRVFEMEYSSVWISSKKKRTLGKLALLKDSLMANFLPHIVKFKF